MCGCKKTTSYSPARRVVRSSSRTAGLPTGQTQTNLNTSVQLRALGIAPKQTAQPLDRQRQDLERRRRDSVRQKFNK